MRSEKVQIRGANEDGRTCPLPNTRTLKCKNQFCGYTWAEDMDGVQLRVMDGLTRCPMCGGEEYEVVRYNFKGILRGRGSRPKRH